MLNTCDMYVFIYSKNATQQVRIVEELPWMLKRAEMLKELANLILNVDILILACAR